MNERTVMSKEVVASKEVVVSTNPANRKEYLKGLLTRIYEEKKGLPEGRLRIKGGTCPRYYHVTEGSAETLGRYLKSAELPVAEALAQKDYLARLEAAVVQELRELQRMERKASSVSQPQSPQSHSKPLRPEDVYRSLNPYRQKLVTPLAVSDEDFAQVWVAEPYERKPFSENDPSFYSARGDRVRSKSEVLIADILDEYRIPYRYEAPLRLRDGFVIHPDFTILRLPSRTICYLEHCGRMDDELYLHAFLRRENAYIENGFIPGRDVFHSFESTADPINTKLLRKMLRSLFV